MTNAINLHGNNLYFHENHPVISKVLCFIPFLGDRVGRYCLDEIDTRIQELGGRHLFQRADGIENLVDCLKGEKSLFKYSISKQSDVSDYPDRRFSSWNI